MGKDLNGKDLGTGLSQRRDGRYEARAQVNGVKIDIYNTSLAKLKKEFAEAKKNANNVVHTNTTEKKTTSMTVRQWFDIWFKDVKSKALKGEYNRKVYKRKIENTYIKELGEKDLKQLKQLDIQRATNVLLERYQERTIREALGVFRECCGGAILNDIMLVNPCQQIYFGHENKEAMKERRVLEVWEQELLLEVVEGSYYKEAYKFLLLTGVRIGEFSGLQWNDINWQNKTIRINRAMSTGYMDGNKIEVLTSPKTFNSYRTIPFFGETEQILLSWKEKQNMYKKQLGKRWRANPELGDLIWTSTMGSPVTRYVIVHDIKNVEKAMRCREVAQAAMEGREPREIGHLHPHCFRHTFATRCFEKGMDPLVVQAIMGHADYATTVGYTHVLDDKRQTEVDKIGNFF